MISKGSVALRTFFFLPQVGENERGKDTLRRVFRLITQGEQNLRMWRGGLETLQVQLRNRRGNW